MTDVVVLHEGYYFSGDPARACSTITLVRDEAKVIIVDPGTVPVPSVLLDRLTREGLASDHVNMVILTHAHTDHFRQVGLFPAATLLDSWGVWEGDVWPRLQGPVEPYYRTGAHPRSFERQPDRVRPYECRRNCDLWRCVLSRGK